MLSNQTDSSTFSPKGRLAFPCLLSVLAQVSFLSELFLSIFFFLLAQSFVSTLVYRSKLFFLPGRNYTQLEDIRQDLLSRVVKGALVDSYVAAERKDLFDDPALYIHQVKGMVSPPCRGHKGVPTLKLNMTYFHCFMLMCVCPL